jgi:hypothetical protein
MSKLLPSLWKDLRVWLFVQPSSYQTCVVSKREHVTSTPWLASVNLLNKNHVGLSGETFIQFVIVKDIARQHWHVEISASFCITVELDYATPRAGVNRLDDHIDGLLNYALIHYSGLMILRQYFFIHTRV